MRSEHQNITLPFGALKGFSFELRGADGATSYHWAHAGVPTTRNRTERMRHTRAR